MKMRTLVDIRRLAALSPEFAEIWERHEVAGPAERTLRFRHPAAGLMTFTRNEYEVSAQPGLRISVYSPQDADTAARLPLTRRGATTRCAAQSGPARPG